jgi:hypothetical protein
MLFHLPMFLHRRTDTAGSRAWWDANNRDINSAPGLIRQLARGQSVVSDPVEANQAVAWAKAHPAWRDDDPPFVPHDSVVRPPGSDR